MTKLLYMEDFNVVSCEAKLLKQEEFEGKTVLILDQTCFYPKGGGQDFDTGIIGTEDAEFKVEAVFFVDGEVKHIGDFTNGKIAEGSTVKCSVDTERRLVNTKLHSAGHVIDMAIRKIGLSWIPGKGAHYPHMSFVEYSGEFDVNEKSELMESVQECIDNLVKQGSQNTISFMTPEEMKAAGAHVPDNLPTGKPTRAVIYNDFPVPCGGTHVQNIADLEKVTVTNIKRKDGSIRVSYTV